LAVALAGCGYTPCDVRLDDPVAVDMTVSGCRLVGQVRVVGGATLTVEPGTRLEFEPEGFLHVNSDGSGAALAAQAEAHKETISFTSARGPLAEPGDWGCVHVQDGSFGTYFDGVEFEWGGAGCRATGHGYEAMLVIDSEIFSISRTDFRLSAGSALLLTGNANVIQGVSQSSFAAVNRPEGKAPTVRLGLDNVYAMRRGNTFLDRDDYIEVDTGRNLVTPGLWQAQPVPYRLVHGSATDMQAYITTPGGGSSDPVRIGPGTVIELEDGSILVNTRTLEVRGTAERPVVFTSVGDDPANRWGCIQFGGTGSPPSSIDHAILRHSGSGTRCGATTTVGVYAERDTMVTNTRFEGGGGVARIATREICPEVRYPADSRLCAGNDFGEAAEADIVCGGSMEPRDCAEE
jgi:hypothetical protein